MPKRWKGTILYAGYVLLPPIEKNGWSYFSDRLTQDGIRYLEWSFLSKKFTAEHIMASRFDPHPAPAVHRRMGESLASYIRTQMGSLP
jgi:hypothetical protein